MHVRPPICRALTIAALGVSFVSASASAATIYSKTYTDGAPETQGGPYWGLRTNRPGSTTAGAGATEDWSSNTLKVRGNGDRGALYDQGFLTTHSNYTIKVTHVSSPENSPHGIFPLALHTFTGTDEEMAGYYRPDTTYNPASTTRNHLGGIGAFAVNSSTQAITAGVAGDNTTVYDLKWGVHIDTGADSFSSVGQDTPGFIRPVNDSRGLERGFFLASNQVSGDGVTNMDATGVYDLTIDVVLVADPTITGSGSTWNLIADETARAGNKLVYTYEQAGVGGVTNKWVFELKMQTLLDQIYGDPTGWRVFNTLNQAAWNEAQTVGFSFYSGTSARTHEWDNLVISAVPEPTSLAALGLGGLALLARRRRLV